MKRKCEKACRYMKWTRKLAFDFHTEGTHNAFKTITTIMIQRGSEKGCSSNKCRMVPLI